MSNYTLLSPIDVKSSSVNGQVNLFSAGSSNSVQIRAPAGLAGNVDFTLPSTSGTNGQYLQLTGGGGQTGWITANPSRLAGDTLPIVINCQQQSSTPTNSIFFNSTSPQVLFYFIYGGTTTSSSPTIATFNFMCNSPVVLTISDITHSTTIATVSTTSTVFGAPTSVSTTSITNLPTTQSLFAVLGSVPSGLSSGNLFSISLI